MRWIKDRKRCQEAGIPEAIRFQTKCEQARQMIERLWLAKIPFAWVVADTVYGGNEELRTWLEAHGYSFVLAVACDEPVEIQTPEGLKRMTVAQAEASFCREEDWQRLSMSQGTKGPRLFDWAVMPMLHRCADDGRHFLLIRRCVDDPSEKAYYFVFAPLGATLVEMVQAIGQRWKIEECARDRQSDRFGGLRSAELHRLVSTHHSGHARASLPGRDLRCGPDAACGVFSAGRNIIPLPLASSHHARACVICSPAYSGPCLAAQRCCSPGPGGGAVISVGPVIFIRNTAVLQGNRRLARSDHHLCSAVSDSRESPWSFPRSHSRGISSLLLIKEAVS